MKAVPQPTAGRIRLLLIYESHFKLKNTPQLGVRIHRLAASESGTRSPLRGPELRHGLRRGCPLRALPGGDWVPVERVQARADKINLNKR